MRRAAVILALSVGLFAAGADRKTDPAPQPPQSVEGRLAKTKYDEALKKAAQEFDRVAAEARKQYLDDLTALQKAAAKAEQVDEAVRIRRWREVVEHERDGATTRGLREGTYPIRGSQFRIVLTEASWTTAREMCQKMGGDLAVLDTPEKRELIGQVNGTLELYVGASKDKNGKWKWVNGQAVEADAWEKGRPENFGGYSVVFPKGTLGDCGEKHPVKGFICEWKK